ncbi:putative metal homeostasis protein [Levilactobacillus brevis]|uniref:Metal homeostasis protein n=1 Tax=Levilactobacillus brevis TaxID=1580 RepID=A0AA41ERZ5_LEVBR|nr:putative metal homeostasis protein [Levilactobacillus brevis]MBS0948664.1 putative metal homeostasis protein [Levilactobacillus brevis]MBS0979095.1 putative metal homeostasis protein [Levilactobacillus brevis]MBS1007224.1 putative metal homeostasis protein [Levilactobacillus brevis]MBS1011803.1 putative metal homeostasis protein [Levilactobacillus brevis]MBS1014187.1 putative metal homeostasis protein [Levilactobacillus brevis]
MEKKDISSAYRYLKSTNRKTKKRALKVIKAAKKHVHNRSTNNLEI